MTQDMPNLSAPHVDSPDLQKLEPRTVSQHPPRILLLFGSLRPTSDSRLLALEAERILRHFGAADAGLRSARLAARGQRAGRSSEGG
jgi:arsenic resistance protein ArsH